MVLNVFDRLLDSIPKHEIVESDIAFRVAQRIDFLMRKNNLNKSELANGMDKDPAQISRWFSGTHNFSIKTLAELEIFFREQILVSPTANEEVVEYTQYIAEQTAKKSAEKEYEAFKANQVNNPMKSFYQIVQVPELLGYESMIKVAHSQSTENAGNYKYAMGA
jgi:transcriptional regulator with XRE-family HTH domain